MSESDNYPKFSLIEEKEEKEEEEIIKIENQTQPRTENPVSTQEIVSELGAGVQEKTQENLDFIKEGEEEVVKNVLGIINIVNDQAAAEVSVSSTEAEKPIAEDEDDDGFRTPTSLDHKIPAIIQCPPAPKKNRPQPSSEIIKRKASPTRTRRILQFDAAAAAEVESIFRPRNEDSVEEQKFKKARRDGGDGDDED